MERIATMIKNSGSLRYQNHAQDTKTQAAGYTCTEKASSPESLRLESITTG